MMSTGRSVTEINHQLSLLNLDLMRWILLSHNANCELTELRDVCLPVEFEMIYELL
ncbi:hypothetical protein Mapa_008051 [Marchantia paleacea]|nr:hypothetical protein Mapa_008051 [Marchantia paleacea]